MKIQERRRSIYNYFHESENCQKYFTAPENEKEYSGYYTSMYLLQDTAESIAAHRRKGFAEDSLISYIEFWGIMQAIVIQQDAISELYWSIINCKLDASILHKWQEIRILRNICAGHPSKKQRPKNKPLTRAFIGRKFGGYDSFTYEQWQSPNLISHPRIDLAKLISDYEEEASEVLNNILKRMKEKWPN